MSGELLEDLCGQVLTPEVFSMLLFYFQEMDKILTANIRKKFMLLAVGREASLLSFMINYLIAYLSGFTRPEGR